MIVGLIDVETGGFKPETDPIIEVGAILWCSTRRTRLGTYASLVRAETNRAEEINHIPPAWLTDAPERAEVIDHLLRFVSRAEVLVGHTVHALERRYLPELAERPWADTQRLPYARPLANRKLLTIAEAYGVPTEGAHRALPDCGFMLGILVALQTEGVDVEATLRTATR